MNRTLALLLALGLVIGRLPLSAEEPAAPAKQEAAAEAAPPATSETASAPAAATYTLRYQFQAGDVLRWEVEHLKNVRTTVRENTQTVEMTTRSVKTWKVLEVKDGRATFENSVERVEMLQRITGREEIRWRSDSSEAPPPGFEAFAQNVGVPLASITIDVRGAVVQRKDLVPQAASSSGQLTIPLPEEAIEVGHVWTVPHDLQIPLAKGGTRAIKTRQRFELADVTGDVATIRLETQLLSVIDDPEVEVQVIDLVNAGEIRFDLTAGRILSQQLDHDKTVVGFSGESSSMRSVSRFGEKFLDPRAQTAALPPQRS